MWVFGYGSIVWRPDFPHAEARPGYLRGFARRFYQGSPDHRGVPGAPGRVVTLLPDDAAWTGGVAYRVPEAAVEATLARLDHREQAGYERLELAVYDRPGGAPIVPRALVYLAGPGNPNYLGPASPEQIAAHAARSSGPSGDNADYVRRLAAALRARGLEDPHVFEVAAALRRLEGGAP